MADWGWEIWDNCLAICTAMDVPIDSDLIGVPFSHIRHPPSPI
jgi:hypothetical protein